MATAANASTAQTTPLAEIVTEVAIGDFLSGAPGGHGRVFVPQRETRIKKRACECLPLRNICYSTTGQLTCRKETRHEHVACMARHGSHNAEGRVSTRALRLHELIVVCYAV